MTERLHHVFGCELADPDGTVFCKLHRLRDEVRADPPTEKVG